MPLTPLQATTTLPPSPQTPPPPGTPTFTPMPASPAQYTVFTVPQTAEEMAILQAQRARLSDQIMNVREQRQTIARQYEHASGANRAGLELQLRSLDERLLQLQSDLSSSARALYQSRVGTATTGVPHMPSFNVSSGQMTAISIVFIACVLGPLAASLGRLMWRRSAKPAMPPGWSDAAQRLERLEQAVDTIAVEMERVSEGQRFMTKLMTQGAQPAESNGVGANALNGGQPLPALGAGSAEPVVFQNQRDEVRVRRS